MELALTLLLMAAVFGICFAVDKCFTKLFRSKAQHRSGTAVKPNKRYPSAGILLSVLGIAGVLAGIGQNTALLLGGIVLILMGAGLVVYYLGSGIYYNQESFLQESPGKEPLTYPYGDIRGQKLYVIQGGSVIVELHMADGSSVSVHSTMDGALDFLNHAFFRWCEQTGTAAGSCAFHDPAAFSWFPELEET